MCILQTMLSSLLALLLFYFIAKKYVAFLFVFVKLPCNGMQSIEKKSCLWFYLFIPVDYESEIIFVLINRFQFTSSIGLNVASCNMSYDSQTLQETMSLSLIPHCLNLCNWAARSFDLKICISDLLFLLLNLESWNLACVCKTEIP